MDFLKPQPDVLAPFADRLDLPAVQELRDIRVGKMDRKHWRPLLERLQVLQKGAFDCALDREAVTVSGFPDAEVEALCRELIPWRKGPFDVLGTAIDSEWRSSRKWDRLVPHLDSLENKRVCDVGCGNGYYMFRAAAQNPSLLLGIDPSEKFFLQFYFLQHFIRHPALQFEMLGVEHLTAFPQFFDVVLCLGIIYHQRHPLKMLKEVFDSLAPGGQAMIESMGLPGDDCLALSPPGRYAKAKNVYFVPTGACLVSWMQRVGFKDVTLVSSVPTTVDEQRATDWMPFESYPDFIDPTDSSKTIEGHPAPLRIAVSGRRPNKA